MADEIDEELLLKVDKQIEDLRNWFDQYFMGARKRAPLQERTSVQYLLRRLSNQKIQNTRLSFQFQQLVSKFNSYNQFWNRNLQKLEMGIHRRDQFKAKLAQENMPPPPPLTPTARPKPAAGKGGQDIDKLYKDFSEARQQLNQPSISKEKLADSIKKQLPALQERYKGKSVEFKVVVENGQAKLKATVK